MPADHLLDALVFSSPEPRLAEVFVAGRRVLAGGAAPALAQRMREAMQQLWA
jgi:formimidoylglutamate deiminase